MTFAGAGDPRDVRVTTAPHVGAAHHLLIDHCLHAMRATPGLHYIAHFGSGVFDFSVDVIESRECASLLAQPSEAVRDHYARSCRQLVVRVEDFDASLRALNSGELMRTVVEAGSGAMHCARLRSGEYLVGATFRAARSAAMDVGMSDLATVIRVRALRLGDENPGGDVAGELPEVKPIHSVNVAAGPGIGHLSPARLNELWTRAINAEDLHYAALYRDWAPAYVGDAFRERDLGVWFTDISVNARRALYQDVAQRLRTDIARLRHALRRVVYSTIKRLVLDVQAGALYVHWLGTGPGDFLIGVTLFQDKVDYAEARLRWLATEIHRLVE